MILSDHLASLRRRNSDSFGLPDIATFIIVPALLGVILSVFVKMNDNALQGMVTAASIFAGLLFNLLLLCFDLLSKAQVEKSDGEPESKKRLDQKRTLLQNLYANISFLILLAIAVIMLCVTGMFFRSVPALISLFIWVLSLNFMFTLLMVLKRVHSLLKNAHDRIGIDDV